MYPDARPDANGVAVKGDRILSLIRREQVEVYRGPGTQVIDLGDRPLLPGFVDAHAHAEVVCRTT
jgi:predicted amidohydrolase YtcJ